MLQNLYLFGHPGEVESFRNYKDFRIIFPKTLDAILRITEERIFLIPLGFLFYEKQPYLGSEMYKINLLHKLRKLYTNGPVI